VKSWPDAHYSEVTLEFIEKEGVTELKLTQTGIPDSEFERTRDGWNINYWNRIKQVFGFGSNIF
jgi:activator of HSP90 ATPase